MARWNTGEKNGLWNGGRSVASNGYVLVRVGTEHHLADVRGYAYEHRIVAEEKIGRRLEAGEQVHHIDGNKQNNSPENLQVVRGNAEHFVHHRTAGRVLRMPGESNPLMACACGCGSELLKYDRGGRPRQYVSGHNEHPAPTIDAIRLALREGPLPRGVIAGLSGLSLQATAVALSKMKRQGLVCQVQHGVWTLTEVN